MPYIGKSPVTGNYNSLDDMSGSFNSSTTTFNLLVNSGTALTPVRAEALIISINGVIQEPGADFTVSAATITYTTAPASTDSFFGVVLGQQLDIATPGDGTVSTAKIADGAVNMAKLGSALTDIADGTVTSPTIANSGDTNTGLYWPAADTVGVTAGGTEVFRFGSSGDGHYGSVTGAKNMVINGSFNVAQRGTSAITGLGGSNYEKYPTDMWMSYGTTSAARYSASQNTPGFGSGQPRAGNGLLIDCTTVESSVAAGDVSAVLHKIEAQNVYFLQYGTNGAATVTVSFWVSSPKTGTHTVSLYTEDTNYSCPIEYTVSSADSYELKTVTFPRPTSGATITNDTGTGLWLVFPLVVGSNYQGTNNTWASGEKYGTSSSQNLMDNTSNNFKLALVQMELGSAFTGFEHEYIGTTLNKCKRYYERITPTGNGQPLGSGFAQSTGDAQVTLLYLEKRAIPTITGTAAGTFTIVHTGGVNAGTGSLSWDQTGTTSCRMNLAYGGSMTDGQGLQISRDATDTTFIEISAEL